MAARTCPMCKGSAGEASAEVLPFCSPTCKLIDLGRWLDGSYRIAGPALEIENENDGHDLQRMLEAEES